MSRNKPNKIKARTKNPFVVLISINIVSLNYKTNKNLYSAYRYKNITRATTNVTAEYEIPLSDQRDHLLVL